MQVQSHLSGLAHLIRTSIYSTNRENLKSFTIRKIFIIASNQEIGS